MLKTQQFQTDALFITDNGAILVDDDEAVLRELDIAEPIPCIAATDDNAEGIVYAENSVYRVCSEEEILTRHKRAMTPYGKWPNAEVPYMINKTEFSKCYYFHGQCVLCVSISLMVESVL